MGLKASIVQTIEAILDKTAPCQQVRFALLTGSYAAQNRLSIPSSRNKRSGPILKGQATQVEQHSWAAWPSKMGPLGCPERSVRKYHSTQCKMPEEHRSRLHRVGSLMSGTLSTFSLRMTIIIRRKYWEKYLDQLKRIMVFGELKQIRNWMS